MFSLFRAIKRKFTGEEEEDLPITNKQKTTMPASLNESPNFLAPIIPNSTSTPTTEETATTEAVAVDDRTILPLRTVKVVVEKVEEPVVEEESKNNKESEVEVEGEPIVSVSDVTPTRPRKVGIDPFTLPTLTAMYANSKLEPVDLEEEIYPYDAGFNEKVIIWRGDITTLSVDAIVNAANSRLLGGGGVDGAIHRAAGEGLYDECLLLNGAETGESKITGGHNLPSLKVIHTVGPIYSRSRKAECEALLRSCYSSTLQLAVDNDCKTLVSSFSHFELIEAFLTTSF